MAISKVSISRVILLEGGGEGRRCVFVVLNHCACLIIGNLVLYVEIADPPWRCQHLVSAEIAAGASKLQLQAGCWMLLDVQYHTSSVHRALNQKDGQISHII
jgi:hypothetical protein